MKPLLIPMLLLAVVPLQAARLVTDAGDRQALTLTLYRTGPAVINDHRRLALPAGAMELELADLAPQRHDDTLVLQTLAGAPLHLLAQVFSPGNGPKPASRPLLQLEVPQAGPRTLGFTYLADGLNWQADHQLLLDADGGRAALTTWATLYNRSGQRFDQARLELVAGTLNRVSNGPPVRMEAMKLAAMAPAPTAQRVPLGDYHLYRLPRPVSLADGARRRVTLFQARDLPVRREYRLEGAAYRYRSPQPAGEVPQAVESRLLLRNEATDGLGQPLPGGVARIYRSGHDGNLRFLGEDQLPALPAGAEATLRMGQAFDLTARRSQTAFRRINVAPPWKRGYESRHRIELKNGGDRPKEVIIQEALPGQWEILEENHPHRRDDSRHARWTLQVPAHGQTVLTYAVRVRE